MNLSSTLAMYNGVNIPRLGLGTWQMPDNDATVSALIKGLDIGYRLIDTAAAYKNETSIGKAIRGSGLKREEVFVTSKVWNDSRGYEQAKKAFDHSLKLTGLDYMDLYLIHWPANQRHHHNWEELNAGTWKAMEELYQEGLIKAIGVSNFLPIHLTALLKSAQIIPMVNQLEIHPGYMQTETVKLCKRHNMVVEAWSPLGSGDILNHPLIVDLAGKYQKSPAQICIRWVLQHDIVALPKSLHTDRILENSMVYDFEISIEDMSRIDQISDAPWSGSHPDEVDFQ